MKEEQNKNELPEGWKWQRLEDALDFVIGGDWGKDENFNDPNYGDAYCIRGAEIKNWNEEKGRTASLRKIKLSNIEKRRLIEGDILVEISGGGPEQPVGRTVLIDRSVLSYKPDVPKICTNFLRLIRPKDFIESKFLNLYLKLFYHSGEIVKYQAGSNNLRNLKFPNYVKINFPLPPKDTQQQIVSKIEELFSELDKGIEELKTAQQQLTVYRQAVLKWAFEGKLTNEDVKESELPTGWTTKKVDELKDNIPNAICAGPFGTIFKAKDFRNSGIPIIFLRHVKPGNYNTRKPGFMDRKVWEELFQSYSVFGGELLITKLGEPPGDCAIYPHGIGPAMVTPDVIKLSVNDSLVDSKYLMYYFNSELSRKALEDIAFGTTRLRITLPIFKKLPIPYCSKDKQQQIVEEIESRLSLCDKIEETIADSLKQAEALRQSILKKAFEGNLI